MMRAATCGRKWVLTVTAAAATLIATAQPALAHEKWFQDPSGYPLRPDLFFRPLPLAAVLAVLIVTVGGGLWWRARGREFAPGPERFGTTPDRRSALYGLVPLILGIHIAVPLLVNGVQGKLFSPDNALPGVWANFLGLAETGIALALFYGAFTRFAAIGLALVWLVGIFVRGLEPMLENSFYLGFAAFFFLAGRGPISVDRLVLPRLEPSVRLMEQAIPALRVGLGLSLIVVAFTEKLANLPLALAFLAKYPLNFTPALGIPLSDEAFVAFAGAVELLIGLWIMLGIFPREIVILAWIPINLTLTIFNWTELVGHLPIYGVMAVLLLWSPGRENLALWVRGLREGPLAILGSPHTVSEGTP
ncbi:MAG: DoxX family protein [Chloroflexia bacterium]